MQPGLFGEMAVSRTETENVYDDCRVFCSARK